MCRHRVDTLKGEEFSFLFSFGLSGGNPRRCRRHRSPLLCSPFYRVACLWLPKSMELPSYILKGLLRNPPACSFFIHSALLSLFTSKCQPLSSPHYLSPTPHPLPPRPRFCLLPPEKVLLHFAIHFHLYYTCLLRCTPLHPLPSTTFLSQKPSLCLLFCRFCFAD